MGEKKDKTILPVSLDTRGSPVFLNQLGYIAGLRIYSGYFGFTTCLVSANSAVEDLEPIPFFFFFSGHGP